MANNVFQEKNQPIHLTVWDLKEQRELLQDDLLCILDGLDDEVLDNVCNAIVDRFNILLQKGKQ